MLGDELSGAALDTLYALFWFGPREAGELPAKSGEAELRELGYSKRVDFPATPMGKDTHLAVLTPEGYAFALTQYS
ncbi:hypothetical protein pEaSNUABM54_00159 [Erwinia phage pEa_SNUABM_54]|nr:hypothetical protein pEaSNUABM54_00159 [Erwinia phage pEa_SNUABM_54]